MNLRKQKSLIIFFIFIISNLPVLNTDVSALVTRIPDKFIVEILPNGTLSLELSHVNTIITFNETNFPHDLNIKFDANYTICNLENTTTIPIIFPLFLTIDINEFMFNVQVNKTQLPYDLFNVPKWNETEIDLNFLPETFDIHPITFIRTNITFLKNSTLVIRFQFDGSINNPLNNKDATFIAYYLGTSQNWIGNTTGRVELRAYGKQPVFTVGGPQSCQLLYVTGGKSFICEWNNINIQRMNIGLHYYRDASLLEEILEYVVWSLLILIPIIVSIIVLLILKKRRKKGKK